MFNVQRIFRNQWTPVRPGEIAKALEEFRTEGEKKEGSGEGSPRRPHSFSLIVRIVSRISCDRSWDCCEWLFNTLDRGSTLCFMACRLS